MRRHSWMIFLLAAVPGVTGCLSYQQADATGNVRFEHLYQRDLPAFEQELAVERHTGEADAWTRLGRAWLAFANCEEVQQWGEDTDRSLARTLHTTLRLEDARRLDLLADGELEKSGALSRIGQEEFFHREAPPPSAQRIEWIPEEEKWGDEVPAPIEIDSKCGELDERAGDDQSNWRSVQHETIRNLLTAAKDLPASERTGNLAALLWRVRMQGARLAVAKWREAAPSEPESVPANNSAVPGDSPKDEETGEGTRVSADQHFAEAMDFLEPLATDEKPVEAISDREYARAQFLYATLLNADGQRAAALSMLADIRGMEEDTRNHTAARYLHLRLLSEAARWEDAAALVGSDLPPVGSRYFGPFVYRAAMALRRTGAEDRFLAKAMEAFRDRAYQADPFLQALYFEVLQHLATYPFDARTVELLEEMGPRGQTFERLEAYARVSLDRGRPENAAAAARWLLANHHNAKFHPRYHALLGLAAFVRDDPEAFRTALNKLVDRPDRVLEAIPTHRRANFFAHADSELARVMRQMLPVMAEWGDAPAARERRQKWLKLIVEQTQDFLHSTEESLARPQLVELYRLASALLEDHPRGYAERVGKEEPAPLVLGMVRVRSANLVQHEPKIRVHLDEPELLTLVPRDTVPPAEWTFGWPAEKEEDDAQRDTKSATSNAASQEGGPDA